MTNQEIILNNLRDRDDEGERAEARVRELEAGLSRMQNLFDEETRLRREATIRAEKAEAERDRIRAETLKAAAEWVRTSQHVYAEDCDGTTEPYPAIAVEDAIAAIMEETK